MIYYWCTVHSSCNSNLNHTGQPRYMQIEIQQST